LDGGSVTVTRWEHRRGEITAEVGPEVPGWVPIRTVSRHVLHAIIVAEDARFYDHPGIDFRSVWDSFWYNWRRGRYARGGSTITQQVVKMAFLSREKSLVRKSREAFGALLLEMILTKEEILEWYINLTEFGDGVYCIRDAARYYWGTKAELLRIDQGVHLAVVIPSPNAWSRGLRARELTPFGHRRFATIVTNMRHQGFITDELWLTTLASGDFGRPINGYREIIAGRVPEEPTCPEGVNCEEEPPIDEAHEVSTLADSARAGTPPVTPTSEPVSTPAPEPTAAPPPDPTASPAP
jgi:monofunctional biosynthetic peptidoglycan transglycosylase